MVKHCKITNNNSASTVVMFDGKAVQMPSIGKDAKEVWVAYENGKYFVVDETYAENVRKREEAAKRRIIKKTTEIDETSEKEDVVDEAE